MNILLVDADAFTRHFYDSQHITLHAPIDLEVPVYPRIKSEIPPYNGFGSEEDSLQTCKPSLIPTAPMKDGMKMNLYQGMILRYKAKLFEPREADKSREFIIQIHLEDDTVQIREPPLRNTGHKGGIFLARCKLESHNSNEHTLQANDCYVGAVVTILSHRFVIYDCDQYTFKYMEGNSDDSDLHSSHSTNNSNVWQYSNIKRVRAKLITKKEILQRLLLTSPGLSHRVIDVFEVQELLNKAGFNESELVMQEMYTLFRAMDSQRTGFVKMTQFLRYIIELQ
jgi:hypothetical protein